MSNNHTTDCVFCSPSDETYTFLLHETPFFRVICDTHPLTEGHLLIIPKEHVTCIGAYSSKQLKDFKQLYERFSSFVLEEYGHVSTFEHGIFGQTVFHSHVHILPYKGSAQEIVNEQRADFRKIKNLEMLTSELEEHGGYLYFTINGEMLLADPELKTPRFFRDRYAKALGAENRMDWKVARNNPELMRQFEAENHSVITRWQAYSGYR